MISIYDIISGGTIFVNRAMHAAVLRNVCCRVRSERRAGEKEKGGAGRRLLGL